jgi:hypothetical protein
MEKNKKVRLYYMGKRKKDIYLNLTKWEKFKLDVIHFFKVVITILAIVGITYVFFLAGKSSSTKIEYKTKEVIKEIEVTAPVLERIAKAESRNSHYCTEELIKYKLCASSELGQVLVKANKNATVDIGRYQINNYYWGAKATELGLNLWEEEDNYKMAVWIFKNKGTEPWDSSSKNW